MQGFDPALWQLNHEQLAERFQGALVDEDGREIPITRAMIQEACRRLEAEQPASHGYVQAPQKGRLLGG